ncbi:MAG: hypothetical protein NVSMB10_17590 [Steroidobacteraceae bacterium]
MRERVTIDQGQLGSTRTGAHKDWHIARPAKSLALERAARGIDKGLGGQVAQIGVSPSFIARGRQAQSQDPLHGILANGHERIGGADTTGFAGAPVRFKGAQCRGRSRHASARSCTQS